MTTHYDTLRRTSTCVTPFSKIAWQKATLGHTALVIGGASGIGWATSKALAADGYQVTIADLNGESAAARAEEIAAVGETVDVTDEDSVAALFERTGPLDVVVTTAGFSNIGYIVDMPVEGFRSVVDVCAAKYSPW